MSSRSTRSSLTDILRASQAIRGFVAELTLEEYQDNLMVRSAVERQLQIVTEAAIRLRGTADKLCPGIDWRAIRGFGNFLRHEYDYVSDREIWASVHEELPALALAVQAALENLEDTPTGGMVP